MVYFASVIYKYLYQDRDNRNCEGEIKAKNRNEAYLLLRKQGIRPYRVIGDDPLNWLPWLVWIGYALLLSVIVILMVTAAGRTAADRERAPDGTGIAEGVPKEVQHELLRSKAELSVYRAPEQIRYDVWIKVNERLSAMGIEKIAYPEGLEGYRQPTGELK